MGQIYADIELINGDDISLARHHHIGADEIRSIMLNIRVDTGADMLCINENIQEYLQLPVLGLKKGKLADGRVVDCVVVGPIELKFKNRDTTCRAMVLPGDCEPLFGCIPMEDMDLVILMVQEELIVNPEHPDYAQLKI